MSDFRTIPGFSDYQIDPLGEIVTRVAHRQFKAGHKSRQQIRHGMYFAQIVCDAGYRNPVAVRTLVMLAFCGKKPDGMRIIHKDGNPLNHHLDNLEYVLLKGRPPYVRKGYAKKLCAEQVSEIRRLLAAGEVKRRIARQFGIDPSMVTMIGNGKRYAAVTT